MNELAIQLNQILQSHVAGKLLSRLGERMYFPQGIVAQTEQSKQAKIKATAGMVLEKGTTIILNTVQEKIPSMPPSDIVAYAPVAGIPALRDSWQKYQIQNNPQLNKQHISSPIVTSGLTHGIHIVASLFLNPKDIVVTQEYIWDNYEHIIETYAEATIQRCAMFDKNGQINATELKQTIQQVAVAQGKVLLMLNFPNNPTGQCILQKDVVILCSIIKEVAKDTIPVMVLCDDAYVSTCYEENALQTSLFSQLASLHENVLAIKIDGATKELCVWGFRVGFITFGNPVLNEEITYALEQKVRGNIRSTLTSCSQLTQNLVLSILQNPTTSTEIQTIVEHLKERYHVVNSSLKKIQEQYLQSPLTPLYFNGGYFMCFDCNSISAKTLRLCLLEQENIALIQVENLLRFTYASVDIENIPYIIDKVYEHAQKLAM